MADALNYYLNGQPAEHYDGTAGTFTRWDIDGAVTEQRPLTEEEQANLAGPLEPEQVTVQVDRVALEDSKAAIAKATSVAGLRTALGSLLDVLSPST